jgi:hypothetical protein
MWGKLDLFPSNLPHNIHFFELVISYPIFTLKLLPLRG